MADYVVGPASEFPVNTHKVVQVRKLKIGVFNVNGDLFALPNICPHQFGPLCEGTVSGTMACSAATEWRHEWIRDGEILTCPWHGIEFDIRSGQALATPKLKIRQYPVRIDDGRVVVTLGS